MDVAGRGRGEASASGLQGPDCSGAGGEATPTRSAQGLDRARDKQRRHKYMLHTTAIVRSFGNGFCADNTVIMCEWEM